MVIHECGVTQMDSTVLKDYAVYANDPAYKHIHKYCPGLDLSGTIAYTIYPGMVVYIGEGDYGKTVIVQTGDAFCVSFGHLSSVLVSQNSVLGTIYSVGTCDKYLHLELLTRNESKWPVRVGSETWYKDDPYKLLDGAMEPYYHKSFNISSQVSDSEDEAEEVNEVTYNILTSGYGD